MHEDHRTSTSLTIDPDGTTLSTVTYAEAPVAELPEGEARMEARVREAGHSWTGPRRAIARFLCSTVAHPTAHDVLVAVSGVGPASSRATVYNTLTLLEQLELIRVVRMTPGEARYDANILPHHHLVCQRCGAVEDIPALDVQVLRHGQVACAEVRFEGLCRGCVGSP
ncbi:MAG: transcriptional repressor [Myxococcales bacterium]|nr:transcriptional repressor [Myxococcales bacterium]